MPAGTVLWPPMRTAGVRRARRRRRPAARAVRPGAVIPGRFGGPPYQAGAKHFPVMCFSAQGENAKVRRSAGAEKDKVDSADARSRREARELVGAVG